ncbi:MAG: LamG domain-containing protein, partial [Phycisphaerae bacterium]
GGVFGDPTGRRYGAAGNILAGEGTLEFWVKPTWAGSDGQGHAFLHWGASGGGMIVLKDGAGNLRGIFNQYGVGGKPEMGVEFGVSSWSAGRWHHVALTWSSAALQTRLYVDGALKSTAALPVALPAIADDSFRVGGGWGGNESRSVLDEIRIYGTARTTAEIQGDDAQELTLHPSLVRAFENSVVGVDGENPST